MPSIEKTRNLGISAHIDSGKTTLSERILYYTGKIHKIEEVKGKSGVGATMDFMDLEREKGITIQSAATTAEWDGHTINLIDTPGHVDFTIEVERALRVLDGAVLVLCGVAGVQSQSYTVDRQMRRYKVPRLAFINKLDRAGANAVRVTAQLKEKLGLHPIALQIQIGAEDRFEGVVDLIKMKAVYFDGDNGETVREAEIPGAMAEEAAAARVRLIEAVAEADDAIAEKYLAEEEITASDLIPAIRRTTLALKTTPVFMGSAYKNKGVQLLLDGVNAYLPNPGEVENKALDQDRSEEVVVLSSDPGKSFVGLAFKLEDGRYGQLTYMRVYQGKIAKGDFIVNCSAGQKRIKVPRLVRMHADEMEDIDSAMAGDIVALFGVDCASGDTFTDGKINYTMTSMHVPDAVISLAVEPKEKTASTNFSKALNRFTKEDPTFRVHRDEESGQTIISGMGELHLEIYIERMKREYNCVVIPGRPQVKYRETITGRADFSYTHKKQTGGSGQYGKVAGFIEPLPMDHATGYEFVDDIVGGAIPREFIPACDKGFQEALKKGPLIGFPIVGVKCTINDGQSHPVDSSEIAFRTAALMGFREAYHKAKPTILEPMMLVEVQFPEEFQGAVIGQLNQRRGAIISTEKNETSVTAMAEVPLADMFGYSTDLRSATQGKGEFSMEFKRYAELPKQQREAMILEFRSKKEKDTGGGKRAAG
ncbi:MAG: elongation factor G [Polyangia bacterium]|jgi:elongation factor G